MFANERRRGFMLLSRISIQQIGHRNSLATSSSSMELLKDLPLRQSPVSTDQSRWFRTLPRRNVIRAKPSGRAWTAPSELPTGRSNQDKRVPRRKAAYAPPSYGKIRHDLMHDESLLETEAAAVTAPDSLATPHHSVEEEDMVVADEPAMISVVEAYYAAKTIDLAPLIMSNLTADATRKKYNRNNLLLELSSSSSNSAGNPSYVAVYRFGSVIFFNVSPRIQVQLLQLIKAYATEPQAKGFEQKDTFGVCILPNATQTRVTPEHCIVPELNMNAVAVISEVMAQSVALESYNEIVDSLLDKFALLNSKISTSSKMDLDKKMLFSKIAQNNRIFIDLISKLRIKGRSQIAWDQGEYEVIHSGMTVEFDIDDRFELIQFKLDLIQQNSKLFLEVIQHQKSASLEYIIVVLIGFECVLMCLDMSGQGAVMFETITRFLS